jgi:glucosyl-3-phosphoglycerate phosphatase
VTAGTVVLWRHGRTEWNAAGRMQGQSDVPLDDVGREQARAAAESLARLEPTAVVASDLLRASATADALAEATGLTVTPDERVRERSFGVWEGLMRAELEERWPAEFRAWVQGGQPEGVQVERRDAVGERFAAAVTEHGEQLGADDTLVVVTHGAAISIGVTALLGLDAQTWNGVAGLSNCHWSVLAPMTHASPPWRLLAHNVGVGG